MEETSLRKWENLNKECLAKIFEAADTETLLYSIPFVCKSWYQASLDPYCWQVLDFKSIIHSKILKVSSLSSRLPPIYELVKFVVDRSQGRTTKVVMGYVTPDFVHVMTYISDGCPMLKTLILPKYCHYIFGTGLDERFVCTAKLIKKWKLLEHLTVPSEIYFYGVLTEISTHCPNFASLTTSISGSESVIFILNWLPNVKFLNLSGSCISRRHLIVILSRYRELQLLDVSRCRGFDEDDSEILEMASHIETFLTKGSRVPCNNYFCKH